MQHLTSFKKISPWLSDYSFLYQVKYLQSTKNKFYHYCNRRNFKHVGLHWYFYYNPWEFFLKCISLCKIETGKLETKYSYIYKCIISINLEKYVYSFFYQEPRQVTRRISNANVNRMGVLLDIFIYECLCERCLQNRF